MEILKGIIVKAIDGFYYILCNGKEYSCKSRKKFRYKEIEPKVGDKVSIRIIDSIRNEGVIEEIFNRKCEFIRPPLTNITQVFIVCSNNEPKINFELLNKLIINFEISNVKIYIVINKCDLHNEQEKEQLEKLFLNFPYEVIFVSVKNNININYIKSKLNNNVSCFCGPSGVGKSSILNSILNKEIMETSELSIKLKRGKHTTRFSQLVYLENIDGYIADTPGFTSIEISKKIESKNLKNYFVDFYKYENCKFRECIHINEIGCKVKEAVNNNEINKDRYEAYVNLYTKFKEMRK